MKKYSTLLFTMIAIGALSYVGMATPKQASAPAVAGILPADTTIGYFGVEAVDAMLKGIEAYAMLVLEQPQVPLPAKMRAVVKTRSWIAKVGFDPTTRAGWQSIGIDPAEGFFITTDLALSPNKNMVFLFKLTARDKLLNWLKERGKPLRIADKTWASEVVYSGTTPIMFLGKRGTYTAVMPLESRHGLEQQRKSFDAYVGDKAPSIATRPELVRATQSPASVGRLLGFLNTKAFLSIIKVRISPEDTAFFAGLFPAIGFATADASMGVRLVADKVGHGALEKLFKAKGSPNLAKFLPKTGWWGMRASINFEQLFQGIADLIPPSKAQVRAMLPVVQASLAMKLGFPYESLVKGFTGHAVIGMDILSAMEARLPGKAGNLQVLLTLGVKDTAAADQVIQKLVEIAANASKGRLQASPVKLLGGTGFQWQMGPLSPVLIRIGQTVFVASGVKTIEEAVARSSGDNLAATPSGKLLEAPNTVYAFTADIKSWLEGVRKISTQTQPKTAAEKMNKQLLGLFEKLASSATMSSVLTLDQGLRFSIDGDASKPFVAGALAAIAIPAFLKYMRRAKSSEASMNLRKLVDGQTAYYGQKMVGFDGKPKAAQFAGPAKLTPGNPTQFMCKNGESVKFKPDANTFAAPVWQALNFAPDDPFYYAYQVDAAGSGSTAQFTVRAIGDLDCDGVLSTYERLGTINERGEITMGAGLYIKNALE